MGTERETLREDPEVKETHFVGIPLEVLKLSFAIVTFFFFLINFSVSRGASRRRSIKDGSLISGLSLC